MPARLVEAGMYAGIKGGPWEVINSSWKMDHNLNNEKVLRDVRMWSWLTNQSFERTYHPETGLPIYYDVKIELVRFLGVSSEGINLRHKSVTRRLVPSGRFAGGLRIASYMKPGFRLIQISSARESLCLSPFSPDLIYHVLIVKKPRPSEGTGDHDEIDLGAISARHHMDLQRSFGPSSCRRATTPLLGSWLGAEPIYRREFTHEGSAGWPNVATLDNGLTVAVPESVVPGDFINVDFPSFSPRYVRTVFRPTSDNPRPADVSFPRSVLSIPNSISGHNYISLKWRGSKFLVIKPDILRKNGCLSRFAEKFPIIKMAAAAKSGRTGFKSNPPTETEGKGALPAQKKAAPERSDGRNTRLPKRKTPGCAPQVGGTARGGKKKGQ